MMTTPRPKAARRPRVRHAAAIMVVTLLFAGGVTSAADEGIAPASSDTTAPGTTAPGTTVPDVTVVVAPIPLSPTPTPKITGTARVGSTLAAQVGTWGPAPVTLSYRWLRDGAPITGQVTTRYKLVAADAGSVITFEVTGARAGYATTSQLSRPTALVTGGVLTVAPIPTLTGVAQVGQELVGQPGVWGPGTVDLTYQWYRESSAIRGATAVNYRPTAADVGKRLSLTVTGSRPGYSKVSKTSLKTGRVVAGVMTTTPAPQVLGTAVVGSTLSALLDPWTPGPTTFAYQWYRGAAKISGATRPSYAVTNADAGNTLSVQVTGTSSGYSSVTRISAPTAVVTGAYFTSTPAPTIKGSVRIDSTLSVSLGKWNPVPASFRYQWYRDGVPIDGAVGPSYTLTFDDAGSAIGLTVTASKPGFTDATTSARTRSDWSIGVFSDTYNASWVFLPCWSLGDSYQPCSVGDQRGNSQGVRLYSSGYGDLMLVAAVLPVDPTTIRWRLKFGNTWKSQADASFGYFATGPDPGESDSWHAGMTFPLRSMSFTGETITTPWSSEVWDDEAYFVIGSLDWASVYMRTVTIEYEVIL